MRHGDATDAPASEPCDQSPAQRTSPLAAYRPGRHDLRLQPRRTRRVRGRAQRTHPDRQADVASADVPTLLIMATATSHRCLTWRGAGRAWWVGRRTLPATRAFEAGLEHAGLDKLVGMERRH